MFGVETPGIQLLKHYALGVITKDKVLGSL